MPPRPSPPRKGRCVSWPVVIVLVLAVPLVAISYTTWHGLKYHSDRHFEHFPHQAAATVEEVTPASTPSPTAGGGGSYLEHARQAGMTKAAVQPIRAAATRPVMSSGDDGMGRAIPQVEGTWDDAAYSRAAEMSARGSPGRGSDLRSLMSPVPLLARYSDPFKVKVPVCKPLKTEGSHKNLAFVAPPSGPFPTNCAGREDLCAVVQLVANPQREVMVAVANSQAPGLQGFLNSLKLLELKNFMVVALDEQLTRNLKAQGVNVYFSPNSAQGNHKVSAQKFGILRDFVQIGCSVLLTDTDVVYMQDPFPYLYRDSDVEGMSDGWDAPTAHGTLEETDDPTIGVDNPGRKRSTMRIAALNSGLWFVRATYPSLRLMEVMAHRMATEDLWDQSGYNMELFQPTRDGHFTAGCSVRVLSSLCFLNSKVMFRHVRTNQQLLESYRPVSMHANYHSDKPNKMAQVHAYYIDGKHNALANCHGDGCNPPLVPFQVLEKDFQGIVNDGMISSRNWLKTKKVIDMNGCRPVTPWEGQLRGMTHELDWVPAARPGAGATCRGLDGFRKVICKAAEDAHEASGRGRREVVAMFVGLDDIEPAHELLESVASAAPSMHPVLFLLDPDISGALCSKERGVACVNLGGADVPRPQKKWSTLEVLLELGWNTLVVDPDTVFFKDPFEHLYRDSDVEVASDGWDDDTAYGYDHVVDDASMGWSRFCHGNRMFTRDPGLVFLQATETTLKLVRRVAGRLAGPGDPQETDRARRFFNQELWIPSHGSYNMVGASVRVMNYLCWANTKGVAHFMKNDPDLFPDRFTPVAVRMSYTPPARKGGCARDVQRYYIGKTKTALENGDCQGSGTALEPALCAESREHPPSDGPRVLGALMAEGGKWSWAGHTGMVFEPDGMLKTPWGVGSWGTVKVGPSTGFNTNKLHDMMIYANFAGARHRITYVPTGGYMISQRCGDGDVVLLRPDVKRAHKRLLQMLRHK
mmetsp:Transcript_33722/g.107136  ORF Transcript_33722/g.107136 Transcript_33722/m.107136 type:complete len:979 (+) Transcript_33722:200-3136(+)